MSKHALNVGIVNDLGTVKGARKLGLSIRTVRERR